MGGTTTSRRDAPAAPDQGKPARRDRRLTNRSGDDRCQGWGCALALSKENKAVIVGALLGGSEPLAAL
jgi:hypothetical protein